MSSYEIAERAICSIPWWHCLIAVVVFVVGAIIIGEIDLRKEKRNGRK